MKKYSILTFIITVTLLLLVIPSTGCEGEVSFTTAALSEATMCQGVDKDMQPLDTTDIFATDTPEIFCSVKLSNAPPDTDFRAEWIYIEGELEDISNYLIDEWSITTEGTRYISISLVRPDNEWPRGDYKAVLYINGAEELVVPFTLQ